MRTSHQILLIKGGYLLILFLGIAYHFSDLKQGFNSGMNGPETSETLSFLSNLFLLASAVIGVYIVSKLYHFINSIQQVKVFSVANIKRISTLGWCCMLQSFLLYGFYFSKAQFNYHDISYYQAIISINFEFWLLIFGITLLTIGFVFKKGIELQQEQDLTI